MRFPPPRAALAAVLLYGYPTGRAVVRAWMHSEGHRRNILDPGFRLLGLGAARDDDGDVYAAQVLGRH